MSSRVLRRRSATAAWIYVAVACGILGTIVAARVLGLDEFGVFATALAVVGFFQVLLDLTVEESLTKYGFRYVASRGLGDGCDGSSGRRCSSRSSAALLATLILVALAPFADEIFDADGLEQALLAAALAPARPVLRERRRDGAAPAQPLRPAGRLPGGLGGASSPRDRHRGAARRDRGARRDRHRAGDLDDRHLRRSASSRCADSRPRPHAELGEDVPEIRSFVLQSSVATGVISLRTTLVPLVLGVVAGPDAGRSLPHRADPADRSRRRELARRASC